MTAARQATPRPGLSVGPTSEFSLFFRVKPGQGEALREALRDLQDTPGYRPGDYGMAIATIHEARFVLFDDDTRLAFVTSFDGPWDAYMEDFFTSGPTLALFDVIFRHVEGYDGPARPGGGEGVHPRRRADRRRLRAQLRRHGQGDPQGAARQRGVPAGAGRPGGGGGAAAPGAASRCSTRPPTEPAASGRAVMSDHISGPRALAEPIADITDVYAFPSPERRATSCWSMNTLPFAQPSDLLSDGLIYRFRLRPLTADRRATVRRRSTSARRGVRLRLRLLRPDADGRRAAQDGHLHAPRPARRSSFRVNDEQGGCGHGVRVFAGPRWDPFIMDAPAALKTIATGQAGVHRPRLDLPRRQERAQPRRRDRLRELLGGAELVGVVAETLTRGRFNVRIERVGRPEVKNMMLAPKQFDPVNRDLEIRDLYNMEDAFHLGATLPGRLPGAAERQPRLLGRARRQHRLARGRRRRPPADRARARRLPRRRRHQAVRRAGLVPRDRARRAGAARRTQTCGGRALNDDVMDTIFTLLVNAGNGPVDPRRRRPGDAARRRATFPYLAAPNPDPPQPPEHH